MRKGLPRGGDGGGVQEVAGWRLPDSVGPGVLYALPVEGSVYHRCDLLVVGVRRLIMDKLKVRWSMAGGTECFIF